MMLRNDLFKPWFVGDDWGFEIIDGEYKGVCIQIEKLEFDEKTEGGLLLDSHTVHKPDSITDEELKEPKFQAVVEVIINDILREAIDDLKQTRDNDTKESST
jgi:hypothetical protein